MLIVCLLAALAGLAAGPVWQAREQWHFAQSGDDGVYWVTAKSIAEGRGYRVPNLPGEPYAVKYPPLYPLYLALAWLAGGPFPENLKAAAGLQALLLPAYVALLVALLRQLGASWRRTAAVAALTVATFQVILLASTLMSELLFCCFLMAALLAVERAGAEAAERAGWWAVAGGALAGLAYLTRNAALPLFAAAPAFFLLRRRGRLAVLFLLPAVPMAAAWHWWSHAQAAASVDPFNSNYLFEYGRVIGAIGLWGHVARQAGMLSGAAAEGLLPGLGEWFRALPFQHLVLAAAVAGCIRLGRRRQWPVAVLFTGMYLGLIVLWWFDGLTRLIVPVWPVLLAGIAQEGAHVAEMIGGGAQAGRWRRLAARWAPAALCALLVLRNDGLAWRRMSAVLAEERAARLSDLRTFEWIRTHAGGDTLLAAWKDGAVHLYTGLPASRGLFVRLTPQPESQRVLEASLGALAARYRAGMLVILRSDLYDSFSEAGLRDFRARAEALPESELVYRSESALVYRFAIRRD